MSADYDVIVAGGGPAGLAAAMHAAKAGLRTLVVDPHGTTSVDKACGEGIMPGGVDALRRLGIRPAGRPFMGIRYVLANDGSCEAFGNFPIGSGLGVRRTVLSTALYEGAARAGVRFREGRVGKLTQTGRGIAIEDGTRASWLIAADGLRSPIRRQLGVEQPASHAPRFGLRRHYAAAPWSMHVEVHLADDAEAYVTPVGDDLIGVAILFSGSGSGSGSASASIPTQTDGAGGRYDALLSKFPVLSERLRGAPAATAVRGAGPFEQRVSERVVGNVLLIGDAAGYLDPLTGEGVALGLATAEAAVEALKSKNPQQYEASYRQITSRYFTLTSSLLTMVRHPSLHRPFIKIAHALPSIFSTTLGTLSHLDPKRNPPSPPLFSESPMV